MAGSSAGEDETVVDEESSPSAVVAYAGLERVAAVESVD